MFYCAHCGQEFPNQDKLFNHLAVPKDIQFRPAGILYLPVHNQQQQQTHSVARTMQ
jgi:hypothetical protein